MIGSDILLCTVAKKPHWSLDTPRVLHYAAVFLSICSVWLLWSIAYSRHVMTECN